MSASLKYIHNWNKIKYLLTIVYCDSFNSPIKYLGKNNI